MVNDRVYDTPVEVAAGKPLVPAKEGYFEFFFDIDEHKTPEIREDGTTDYAAVGRLENVKEGQLIAKYHPAVQGTNGFDVLGHEMVAKMARVADFHLILIRFLLVPKSMLRQKSTICMIMKNA